MLYVIHLLIGLYARSGRSNDSQIGSRVRVPKSRSPSRNSGEEDFSVNKLSSGTCLTGDVAVEYLQKS
jgi:hypothetical protein